MNNTVIPQSQSSNLPVGKITRKKRISSQLKEDMINALKAELGDEFAEKATEALNKNDLLAGGKGSRTTAHTFEGSDGTCYRPKLMFKGSKKKNANNVKTKAFEMMNEEWDALTTPIFERLVDKYMVKAI